MALILGQKKAMQPYVDPGWRPAVSPWLLTGFLFGVPLVGRRVMAKVASADNGVVGLRRVFLQFAVAVVLVGVVLAFAAPSNGVHPGAVVGLAVLGVLGLWASEWLGRRPLDCSSDESLAVTYRSKFFLRIAVTESIALVGFVVTLVAGPWWLYVVPLAFTLVGFRRLAPSRANLAAEQTRLTATGCTRSLGAAVAGSNS